MSDSLCFGLSLIFLLESDVLLLESYHPVRCDFLAGIYNLVKWNLGFFVLPN